jgi:predicted ATPase
MATGRRPFTGDNNARLASEILTRSPVPVTKVRDGLPRHLDRIITRCLAKDPGERYQTAPDVHSELKGLQGELAVATLEAQSAVFPTHATPFIGRQDELAALTDLLKRDDVRLLTLTGPGGIGKTRLSLQVAADLADEFEHGALFVELAPITDSDLVTTTIASALGVIEAGDEPLLEILTRSLRKKHLLLVIDNFEHVIAAAPVVSDLIAGAPKLKIMTTSRELLRVYGERDYPVPPLGLPEESRQRTVAAISQCEAVSLFIQRATAAQAGFEITEDNAQAIAEICTRLEGLPLAIELAAARVRLFEPETLLVRLSDSLKTLTGGARDLPQRQQTIRNAIQWSHELLDEDEQTLFARLAVFQGGRSIEAAEAVCGPGLAIEVLDGLESLLNKSLLRREKGPEGETHFLMLETIHAYACERLDAGDEAEELRGSHAAYFAEMAEQASTRFTGHEQGVWLNRLTLDYENLRSAMSWSLGGGDVQTGLRIAGALGAYWRSKSWFQEGQRWLQRAIELVDEATERVQGQLYAWAGFMAWAHQDSAECSQLWEKALAIERRLNNQPAVARLLIVSGFVSSKLSDIRIETTQEGLALAREIDDKSEISHGLQVLGEIHRARGDYAAAKQAYEECLPITREIGDQVRESGVIAELGFVAFNLGDFEQAREQLLEAYKLALEIGRAFIIADGLSFNGGVLGALGQPERAVRLIAAGDSRLAEIGSRRYPGDQQELDKMIALVREQLDDASFDRLWAEGEAMSLEDAIDLVLQEE